MTELEVMSEAEVEAAMNGQFGMPVPDDAEGGNTELSDDEPENDGEAELSDDTDADADADSGDDHDEEAEDTEQADKKPRMNRASQRVKEAVDRANAAEQRLRDLEYKFTEQMRANEKLVAMLTGEKQEQEPENEEVLDEVLAKQVKQLESKLEDSQFGYVRNQEVNAIGGETGEVYQKAVAASALRIMSKAETLGRTVAPLEAENMARQAIESEMKALHKQGAKPGAIAQELMNAASYYDYMVAQVNNTSGKAQPKGVNMKKVEEARQKAGAPNIDREGVGLKGGLTPYESELKKAMESGIDADYLRKLGYA